MIDTSLSSLLLFADTVRTTFTWGRIDKNTDWILPVVALVVAAFFVRKWYERDSRELNRGISWFLTILRTLVFIGLFVIYLQPEWRTETERRIESRVAVLADTSLSMGLTDPQEGAPKDQKEETRAEQIAKLFADTKLLNELRKTHHVDIYTFGDTLHTVTTLEKFPEEGEEPKAEENKKDGEEAEASEEAPKKPLDWNETLEPIAAETRLGDSLAQLLEEVRDTPVAGIIIPTDGCKNMGIDPVTTVEMANESKIKFFPVGVGSDVLPPNVRVSQFVVPPRVQMNDQYTITGYVQARGMVGKTVTVKLFQTEDVPKAKPVLIEERDVTLGADGETTPVRFEMMPTNQGRWIFSLQVEVPKEDRHPADNIAEAQFEIVDRPLRVLLFAGGPMREYRFMRNLLHRDAGIEVDVLLQSALEGVSQDANKVLDMFPDTAEELSKYDCIVAFDPDWRELDSKQIEMVESWVAKQSGGLILFAGAVNLGDTLTGWTSEDNDLVKPIRGLYPVIFQRSYVAGDGEQAGEDPWPPAFTREGKEADFLRLSDDPAESEKLWSEFEGVYAYLPVEGPKQSATVYARFADPTVSNDRTNIYLAGQFYGSGRTFYAGSAELWRLRRLGEKHYERFITKLIRHVTQGRLLNDSPRGMLLIERETYLPGDTVEVKARLNNAEMEPLSANEVRMDMTLPDGSKQQILLKPTGQPGEFIARFPVKVEGNYQLAAVMPDDESIQIERRFQVKMPDRERENPVRNDVLLNYLANATQGRYYLGTSAAAATTGPDSLVNLLPNRTKTIVLTSTPDSDWKQRWFMWMMIVLISLLSVEWTIRRLLKLA
ncbi:MAG: VWA domain-containing protein [Planctomycetia bacterium]|jgi:hypothetical protein